MFIITLFIIAKNGNSPNIVLINEYYIFIYILHVLLSYSTQAAITKYPRVGGL